MSDYTLADSLHRLIKQTLDSGEASDLAQAEALFSGYKLHFALAAEDSTDSLNQIALLTGVALATRVFLGGVTVDGALDVPLQVPLPLGSSLREAVTALGGVASRSPTNAAVVYVGGGIRAKQPGFQIRTVASGWRGGIVPAYSPIVVNPSNSIPLSAMLSAALAVNEAYQYVDRKGGAAGRRPVGVSLWQPSTSNDWYRDDDTEPLLQFLPSKIWLIGLGHLGQAFLWGLALLPYKDPSDLTLMLQDVDRLTPSSESTGILTDKQMCGQFKTRAMATWAERRGFSTSICERFFDASFRRQSHEPGIAFCGIDNAVGRRALDDAGFDFIVEAGLGRTHHDFSSMRLHTLPGKKLAVELWKGENHADGTADRPAYQNLLKNGELDRCGITLLAGKAVGAPFVGSVAACLAIAEVLRLLHEGTLHNVIELDLHSIEHRLAVVRDQRFTNMNPGFVLAK